MRDWNRIMISKNARAKYLPTTICQSSIGAVISDSIVPLRYSSLIRRMLIAGSTIAST